MALIQVTKGPNEGQKYTLDADRTVLGRHPDCDVVLEVAAVSRQHAQIVRQADAFYLEDLGSRNHTFLNDQETQGRQLLREGDRFRICDVDFKFFVTDPSDRLPGLIPGSSEQSSLALLIEDDGPRQSESTVMSTVDVSSSNTGTFLAVRPEVKLSAILEISQNLGKALSIDEVLPKLLDSLFKIFVQADRGFIMLQSGEDDNLIPKAVKHRRPGDEERIRVSRTIIKKAMTTKEAILSADAAADERFSMAQSIADFHIRSLMCAPLISSEGRPLGIIQIDTLDQRSRFSSDDLEVLASVASQASIAVENAQLHEQELRQEALRRDLELAHKVQQGLLPARPPEVAGYHFFNHYEAANQVGGDYYDYVTLPGGRVAVVVGDVSGKGVAAALLMAKLAGEVRFALASEPELARAVSQINAMFARHGWDDRFVTFVAAVLDPAQHELTIVNAGHMPPLLRHVSGEVEEVGNDEAGLPLGVTDDYEYEAFTCKLSPGDFLVVFTDGFSEAMNTDNELYGLENIRRQIGDPAIPVKELGPRLLDDVRKFVGDRLQSDDMCLACFGREEG